MMDEIESAITINSSACGGHQLPWSQLVTPDPPPPPPPPDDCKTSIEEKEWAFRADWATDQISKKILEINLTTSLPPFSDNVQIA